MTEWPFKKDESLSGSDLESLRDWLAEHVKESHMLTPTYSVGDLVHALDSILNGMWNDGIDAMGDDA